LRIDRELLQKSSKIVPLGAPLFSIKQGLLEFGDGRSLAMLPVCYPKLAPRVEFLEVKARRDARGAAALEAGVLKVSGYRYDDRRDDWGERDDDE
jgi:hypothetical protein